MDDDTFSAMVLFLLPPLLLTNNEVVFGLRLSDITPAVPRLRPFIVPNMDCLDSWLLLLELLALLLPVKEEDG